jgi:hypothetical protein
MQRPKILGFSGKIGAGKDTAAAFIKNLYPDSKLLAFAVNVKIVVALLTGTTLEENLDREKRKRFIPAFNATLGELQQKVGNGMRAAVGVNVWIDSVLNDPAEYKIITDVRFPDEVKAIEDAGGMVIRLERSEEHKIQHDVNFEFANDMRPKDDISETALDGYKFKYVVKNDSTLAALKEKILALLYVTCM